MPKALRSKQIRFNGHIIYYIYIKEKKQFIRVKNLLIFEGIETKKNTSLSNYKNGKPTFQCFLLNDNHNNKVFSINKNYSNTSILTTLKKSKNKLLRVAKLKDSKKIANPCKTQYNQV